MATKQTKSAGGIVLNPSGQVAIVKQRYGSWSFPKGHIVDGETPLIAAKREIKEETGIPEKCLEFVKKLEEYQRYRISKDGGNDTSEFKTIIMFLFRTKQITLRPKDIDNPDAVWIDKDKVSLILTHSEDKKFFIRAMKYI